ncbi:hypothetical protein C7M84_001484 [Penaeus vannamei]|uniref:Uncharacterized protein n=1 Tax=Penaeus vannamei TaxID=6689 RepID=A0A423TTL3_PENVA|nr:hypothetical protein C7M84_001484 [Penaeus vannamei]
MQGRAQSHRATWEDGSGPSACQETGGRAVEFCSFGGNPLSPLPSSSDFFFSFQPPPSSFLFFSLFLSFFPRPHISASSSPLFSASSLSSSPPLPHFTTSSSSSFLSLLTFPRLPHMSLPLLLIPHLSTSPTFLLLFLTSLSPPLPHSSFCLISRSPSHFQPLLPPISASSISPSSFLNLRFLFLISQSLLPHISQSLLLLPHSSASTPSLPLNLLSYSQHLVPHLTASSSSFLSLIPLPHPSVFSSFLFSSSSCLSLLLYLTSLSFPLSHSQDLPHLAASAFSPSYPLLFLFLLKLLPLLFSIISQLPLLSSSSHSLILSLISPPSPLSHSLPPLLPHLTSTPLFIIIIISQPSSSLLISHLLLIISSSSFRSELVTPVEEVTVAAI